jgi:hypothetical protein
MNQINEDLKNKNNEIQTNSQIINEKEQNNLKNIETLQQQINNLKNENQDLVQRIIDATKAINDASQDLEFIEDALSNAKNQQEVTSLLENIENSIINISKAIQGQNEFSTKIQNNKIPGETNIVLKDISTGQNINMTMSELYNNLSMKSSQIGTKGPNKYKIALQQIQNITDPEEISDILNNNNINIKNNKLMGGKTKKKYRNKKQRGGFTYNKSYKRKSILTSSSRHSKK